MIIFDHIGSARRLAMIGAIVAPLAACDTDTLLDVEDPEFASPESLNNPEGLPTLVAGAIGDFQVAYSGSGGDAFLSVVSLITDEFYSSGTFTTRTATDQRDQFPTVQGNTSDAAYNRLQAARVSLSNAAAAVVRFSNTGLNDRRYAELKALEGFTYVALAEGFCGPIPFGQAELGVATEEGTPISTQEAFAQAVVRFDSALVGTPGSNLARVGKGRALLNAGDFEGAAAAVAGVPTDFVYFIEHSANSGRQQNPIFSLQANGRYSVSDLEGGNDTGLPYRSAADPRIPWSGPVPGFDSTIPKFTDLRYPDFGSDVPLADGIEARLIEAEAALRRGDPVTWLTTLNDLRANVRTLMEDRYDEYTSFVPSSNNPTTTLPPLIDPGTESARVDLTFSERAFWLYTTGHRLGDMRRLIRQYGRSADSVFPSGAYHKGGVYGEDVNFPIPFDEANNSQYEISMCNTRQA
jgi:hypothetical protein